jgi:hypothetical protein
MRVPHEPQDYLDTTREVRTACGKPQIRVVIRGGAALGSSRPREPERFRSWICSIQFRE